MAGKTVLLTFGLLSPNKGIEYVLRALPDIIRRISQRRLYRAGRRRIRICCANEGEAYRLSLERLAKKNWACRNTSSFSIASLSWRN